MQSIRTVVLAFLVISVFSSAQALDGKRKGFSLGCGLGLGMSDFNHGQASGGIYEPSGWRVAASVDARAGYTLGGPVGLVVVHKLSIVNAVNHVGILHLTGAGVKFHIRPSDALPPLNITAGLGAAAFRDNLGIYLGRKSGLGGFVGTEAEIGRHTGIELEAIYANARSEYHAGSKGALVGLKIVFTAN